MLSFFGLKQAIQFVSRLPQQIKGEMRAVNVQFFPAG